MQLPQRAAEEWRRVVGAFPASSHAHRLTRDPPSFSRSPSLQCLSDPVPAVPDVTDGVLHQELAAHAREASGGDRRQTVSEARENWGMLLRSSVAGAF